MGFLRVSGLVVAAIVALSAASLSAQTYTRTQSSVAYSQRSGGGTNVPFTERFDNGVKQVQLPFAFPFFDRTYNGCWMNTNGQVSFANGFLGQSDSTSLATVVPAGAQREAINAFRTNLIASDFESTAYTVHFETNRVVFQWRNVRISEGGAEELIIVNFQVHLLSSGEIQLHYGPETQIFSESPNFVSGIVNADGTAAFAGFGNLLTVQTARPLADTVVSLIPSGFTQAAGINVAPNTNNDPERAILPNTNDIVIGRFSMTARGAGGTVTSIAVSHMNVAVGQPITTRLYRDSAPFGTFDGSDVQVGTTQSPSGTSVSTFSALTETITTGTTHYLVLANTGALTDDTTGATSVSPAGITSAATVWGGYSSHFRHVSDGPEAVVMVGPSKQQDNFVAAGATNVPLSSFEMRRGRALDFFFPGLHQRYVDFGAITATSMNFTLNLGTLVIGDIAELRLYRDGGTRGVVDGSDTLLSTVTSPATTTITFSGLTENIPLGGQDYLVTFSVGAAVAVNGAVSITANATSFLGQQTNADFFDTTGFGAGEAVSRAMSVIGTTAATYLRRRNDAYLAAIPVRPSDLSVPAMAFSLQASTGTANVTQIQFTATSDATTYLSAARLYVDAGTPGRFDGADTQIGGAGTIAATTLTFTVSQTIGTTATNYLLVVDISAAAASNSVSVALANAGVTSSTTVFGGTVAGASMTIGAASANGVDITGLTYASNVNMVAGSLIPIASIQLTPRGTGGFAPQFVLDIMNGSGGVGTNSGVCTVAVIEGSGPLGVLDSSDYVIPDAFETNVDQDDAVPLMRNTSIGGAVTGVRNILVCVFTGGPLVEGRCTIVFRGLSGGTDVRWTSGIPAPTSANANVSIAGGGGGGGGDDGGCSTGFSDSRFNVALLAGVLGMMVVALRTRRKAA